MEEISRKMAAGAAWMIVARITDRLLGLVSTLVLVRLLLPADFGLLAMATSVIALLGLLGSFSFELALIQNPKSERRHYDTVWTFGVLFSIALAAVLMLLAFPAAGFYNEPRLAPVMQWLGVGSIVGGLGNVGVVAFRKEMRFDKEFKFLFVKKLISVIVTATLAFILRDYRALVAGVLTGQIAGVILSYVMHPFRPKLSLAAWGELLTFSKWLFFNNIFSFFNGRLADFVIGRIAGPHALGLYSVSLEVSNLPTTELSAPINRAVFSGYARMADNLSMLRNGFLNVISMIALLVLPAGAGIVVVANAMVPVVLGPNWSEAILLVQILAFHGAFSAMVGNTHVVIIALGTPRVLTLVIGGQLAVLAPAMWLLTRSYGAVGAAMAVAGSTLLFLPVYYYMVMTSIELRFASVFSVLWRPATASITMALCVKLVEWELEHAPVSIAPLLHLLLLVAIGVIVYAVLMLGLWKLAGSPDGAERFVVGRGRRHLQSILAVFRTSR